MAKKSPEVAMPSPAPAKQDVMDDYDVKNHLDAIVKAHQVISNPKKMKKVHALVKGHKKAISSIQDLRDLSQRRYGGVGGKPKTADDDDLGE